MMLLVTSVSVFSLFVVFSSGVSAEGSCGAKCCQQKVVGESAYTLAYETKKNLPDSCKDGCVYTKDDDIDEGYFCFKPGSLKVKECTHCRPLPGNDLF